MNILEQDVETLKYKLEQGEYYSCEMCDIGRMDIIWEIIIVCKEDVGEYNYYRLYYEGDLECVIWWDDVKDDFTRVVPIQKVVTVFEDFV